MYVAFQWSKKPAGKRDLSQNFFAFLFRNSVNRTHLDRSSLFVLFRATLTIEVKAASSRHDNSTLQTDVLSFCVTR